LPEYDAVVIGTGQAGPPLAMRLAGAGMKVAAWFEFRLHVMLGWRSQGG